MPGKAALPTPHGSLFQFRYRVRLWLVGRLLPNGWVMPQPPGIGVKVYNGSSSFTPISASNAHVRGPAARAALIDRLGARCKSGYFRRMLDD